MTYLRSQEGGVRIFFLLLRRTWDIVVRADRWEILAGWMAWRCVGLTILHRPAFGLHGLDYDSAGQRWASMIAGARMKGAGFQN